MTQPTVVVDLSSPSGNAYMGMGRGGRGLVDMRNSNKFTRFVNTSVTSTESLKWCRCSSFHFGQCTRYFNNG